MLWGSVTFMTGLTIWAGWSFYKAPSDTSLKEIVFYATAFLFAMQCVGWTKMFLFSNQKSFSILKELKRVQLLLVEKG